MTVRYTYIREAAPPGHRRGRPFGVIAFEVKRELTNNIVDVFFSLSTANPSDDFDKALGRTIALGRFANQEHFITSFRLPTGEYGSPTNYILSQIYAELAKGGNYSSRVVKAAKRWLSSPLGGK